MVRISTAVVVFVGIALFPCQTFGQMSITACINPAGQMRLANGGSCHPEEQLVVWPTASVVDSTGALVGFYTGGGLLMNVDGHRFSAVAGRNGFTSASFGVFFQYLTPGCDGQRYGNAANPPIVPNAIVLGQEAWFLDLNGQSVTLQSGATVYGQQTTPAGPIGPCITISVFGTMTLLPMTSIDVGSFVPPFSLSN